MIEEQVNVMVPEEHGGQEHATEELLVTDLDMHERVPVSSGDLDDSNLESEPNRTKSEAGDALITAGEVELAGVISMEQTEQVQSPSAGGGGIELKPRILVDGTPISTIGELAGDSLMEQIKEDQNLSRDGFLSELNPRESVDGTSMDTEGERLGDDLMEKIKEDRNPSTGGDAPIEVHQETSSVGPGSPVEDMTASSLVVTRTKRKLEVLLSADATGKKIKKSPQNWHCAVCQISVTSEQHISDHLQGKKHKFKVAKLTSSAGGSNVNNNNNVANLTSSSGDSDSNDNNPYKLTEPDSISSVSAERQKDLAATKGENKKKTEYWCEICSVGTNSEQQMSIHRKGKKHISLASKLGLPQQQIASTGLNGVENKNTNASIEKSEEAKPTSVLAKQVEAAAAADESCDAGVSMSHGKKVMKFFCKMCEVTMYDEREIGEHRKGDKHMDLLKKSRGAVIVVSVAYLETDAARVPKESDATADA